MTRDTKCVVAIIDHSFHKLTQSTAFWGDAFEDDCKVIRLWDDGWKGGTSIDAEVILERNPTIVCFFQVEPSIEIIRDLRCSVIFVPMYDAGMNHDLLPYLALYGVTAVTFSSTQDMEFRKLGISTIPIRFAPLTIERASRTGPVNVFFWERSNIRWADVRELLADQEIGTVYLKLAPDPEFSSSQITKEDRDKFNLVEVAGWVTHEEYLRVLDDVDLCIAPRRAEGIGMSFLEAMARGVAVAAFDAPTMNEYVKHGSTGYLFTIPPAGPLDLSRARELGAAAQKEIADLRIKFERRLPEVVNEVLRLKYRRPNRLALAMLTIRQLANANLVKWRIRLGSVKQTLLRTSVLSSLSL